MDSLIKPLETKKASNKAAFGRHETFALRYAWLTKGFQTFQNKPDIFSSDESTIQLGVGKNMVNAIRYWLRATQMTETTKDGLKTTDLGFNEAVNIDSISFSDDCNPKKILLELLNKGEDTWL